MKKLTYPVVPCGSLKHGKAVTTLSANAFFSNAPGLQNKNENIQFLLAKCIMIKELHNK